MADEIFEAIHDRDAQRVGLLLSRGADPSGPSTTVPRLRPLEAAIEEVYHGGSLDTMLDIIGRLIQHGADVNAWDDEHHLTPLLAAVYWDNREAARLLLDAGADSNVVNRNRESPLSMAVEQNDVDTVVLLLAHGAAKNINMFGGVGGMTPLGIAASNLNVPLMKHLLEAGADPEAPDADRQTARDYLPPRDQSDPEIWDDALEMLALKNG